MHREGSKGFEAHLFQLRVFSELTCNIKCFKYDYFKINQLKNMTPTLKAVNERIWIFTHLKLCLAAVTHNWNYSIIHNINKKYTSIQLILGSLLILIYFSKWKKCPKTAIDVIIPLRVKTIWRVPTWSGWSWFTDYILWAHLHAHHGQSPQEWGLPQCKYYVSVKRNDPHALKSGRGGFPLYADRHLNINPFSAGTDFRRQILTSKVGPRTEKVKYV